MATILCIDDNVRVLEIYKTLLESEGYTILTAPDGPTGLALARTNSVDAVVLDVNMPGMNGDQVAEMLIKEHPSLPVVIWSGCPDEIPESLKWYADALLHKGDGPDSLLSAIEKIVGTQGTNKKPPGRTICRESISGLRSRPQIGGLRASKSRP